MAGANPIATFGEIFAGGALIDLIRDVQTRSLRLLLWDGREETSGTRVKFRGNFYASAAIDQGLTRELTLPTHRVPHGSTSALLAALCKLFADLALLPEKLASLVGRFVLATWLLEATQIAPALAIAGPDVIRGNHLISLLHCVCRHPVRLTGVTPAGLCSLPSGLECTLLITQGTLSDRLQRLLDDASRRNEKIPWRGGLLDLYGGQVIDSEFSLKNGSRSFRYVQVPLLPTNGRLLFLDTERQERIAADFQPRLLDFRRANLRKACGTIFDASGFAQAVRPLVQSLAAATPCDAALQSELSALLREEDVEARSAKRFGRDAVILEAILFASHKNEKQIYVGKLAEIAQEILTRRGNIESIDPGALGKTLINLGFVVGPRDSRGVKLILTKSVCDRARQLARDFGVPRTETNGGETRELGK